ncbi:hypothetical protein GH714_012403 [Hevea brasiliensis]|uniref:Uncharacterized protein n=1 Tax=Hevea brasiliensis TaxID=3981 RepID=A0A6A6KR05_HEVBR|nr:hypothetical protein GH714_012403 [Hevea brasiliensis]
MNIEYIKPSSNSSVIVVEGNASEDKIVDSLKRHAVSGIALPSRWDKLFSGSSDRTVHVWDCDTGQSIIVINLVDKIWALISEDPGYLHGTLRQLEVNLDGPVGQVYAMAVAYVVDMLFAGAQLMH